MEGHTASIERYWNYLGVMLLSKAMTKNFNFFQHGSMLPNGFL
jgi:hypothetical protein